MKFAILFLSFFWLTISVSAQQRDFIVTAASLDKESPYNPYPLKGYTTYRTEAGNRQGRRARYSYNTEKRLATSTVESFSRDLWKTDVSSTFSYDSSGRFITEIQSFILRDKPQKVKVEYSLDNSGRKKYHKVFLDDKNQWKLMDACYFVYDDNNRISTTKYIAFMGYPAPMGGDIIKYVYDRLGQTREATYSIAEKGKPALRFRDSVYYNEAKGYAVTYPRSRPMEKDFFLDTTWYIRFDVSDADTLKAAYWVREGDKHPAYRDRKQTVRNKDLQPVSELYSRGVVDEEGWVPMIRRNTAYTNGSKPANIEHLVYRYIHMSRAERRLFSAWRIVDSFKYNLQGQLREKTIGDSSGRQCRMTISYDPAGREKRVDVFWRNVKKGSIDTLFQERTYDAQGRLTQVSAKMYPSMYGAKGFCRFESTFSWEDGAQLPFAKVKLLPDVPRGSIELQFPQGTRHIRQNAITTSGEAQVGDDDFSHISLHGPVMLLLQIEHDGVLQFEPLFAEEVELL